MELFLNEKSLHGQYADVNAFAKSIRTLNSLLSRIAELPTGKQFFKSHSVYSSTVTPSENFAAAFNHIRDKSIRTQYRLLIYNRLVAKDWRVEQRHSNSDHFACNQMDVSSSTMAETAERKLLSDTEALFLLNFSASLFSGLTTTSVRKNGDAELVLSCGDSLDQLNTWLTQVIPNLAVDYGDNMARPPWDYETILCDRMRFSRTSVKNGGRTVYKDANTGYRWYIDSLHVGPAAHIEVFDREGLHVGEASLQGIINVAKADTDKTIDRD